ncbi:MAG: low molecular weight phosphotyrosine protein phosphatase [Brucellaceae bacterium]|jgi:protein-tyrosine phosphatase|nr:low molecular weight phosphotyrosine protein phosphatase [Brucellaceae bacterium]
MQQPFSILFICLGNICRSPLAEGVMRSVLQERFPQREFLIDSAGTNGYHTGEAPDDRSIAIAAQHGIDISAQRCRQLSDEDFSRFNLILGMDQNNLMTINRLAPAGSPAVTGLFTAIARDGFESDSADRGEEIPDPYYGGTADFQRVYTMVREAAEALADQM